MAGGSSDSDLNRHLNILARLGVVGDHSDAQLVQRYLAARDDSAHALFAVLVERHGPMVLDVCRHVLKDPHDAQDAFQATFLVLARKAGSLRRLDSLASWLHGVALRVAAHARANAARRRKLERKLSAMKALEPTREDAPAESWPELHEEIARLPRHYREPVVLCYLEGLSTEAAALRIGCPRGTVLSRLSRARDTLRGRLIRRGVTSATVLVMAEATHQVTNAALPAVLVDATVHAALGFAGRPVSGAGVASSTAAKLARGVIHAMTVSKLKILGGSVLASVLALGGAQGLAFQFGGIGVADPVEQDAPNDAVSALAGSVDKLQRQLDQADMRNAELRKELQKLQAELKVLQTAPGRVSQKPSRKALNAITKTNVLITEVPERAKARISYRSGRLIVVTSSDKSKAALFDTATNKSHPLPIPSTKESPLEMSPIGTPGVVAIWVKGPKITRIAAASENTGTWQVQELREPVEEKAVPIMAPGVAVYALGRYVYAFSGSAQCWDVVEMPDAASASTPILSPGSVQVTAGNHVFTFNATSGKWSDLDLNAILNSDDDPSHAETKPSK